MTTNDCGRNEIMSANDYYRTEPQVASMNEWRDRMPSGEWRVFPSQADALAAGGQFAAMQEKCRGQQQGAYAQYQQGMAQPAIWPSGAVPRDYIQHAIDNGLARPAVPFRINQLENEVHCLRSAFQVERKRTAELEAENNDLRDMIALLRMQMKADAAPVAAPDAKPFPLRALSDRKPRLGPVVSNG